MGKKLDEMNADLAFDLIPAILYIAVLMIIGLIGNPLVIYYYGYRMKATPSYMFITSLACYDLVSCIISMPLEIVDLVYFITFQSPMACRILRFVNHFAQIASGGTLLIIAVDRYRKLCHPLKMQFTNGQSRTVIFVILGLSIFCSWPSLVFYTVVDVEIISPTGSLIGQDCSTENTAPYTEYVTAYNSFLLFLFFGGLLALIILYALIAKQVYGLRSFKFYTSKDQKPPPSRAISMMTISSEIEAPSILDSAHGNIIKSKTGSFGSNKEDGNTEHGLTPIEEDTSFDNSDEDSMLSEKEIDDLTNDDLDDTDDVYTIPVEPYESTFLKLKSNIQKTLSSRVGPQFRQQQLVTGLHNPHIAPPKPIRLTQSFTERPFINKQILSKPRRTLSEMTVKTIKLFQAKHFAAATNPSRISWIKKDYFNGSQKSLNSEEDTRVSRCGSVDVDQMNMRAQNINTRKFTIVAVSITVAFIVSFLPNLVLKTWSTLKNQHEASYMNTAELVVFQIFVRSFLLNSICNPFIYGMFNVEFKKMIATGFKRLFSMFRCCKIKCTWRHNKVKTVIVAEAPK